jgi:predicted nucleotide-binding protein (sugar kinase/HSP70/actin superfamily)
MKKVGIPRALMYYKFSEMWTKFFTELGTEVIVSPETTKKIKDISVKSSPDEDCYSTKLYFGHSLVLKDKVDYLFIPRYGGNHRKYVGCPKFIGFPEVLQSMFPDLPEVIMPYYNSAISHHGKIAFFLKAFDIGLKFTKNPFKILISIRRAVKAHKKYYKKLIINQKTLQKWEETEIGFKKSTKNIKVEPRLKIALAGHSYVLNDPYPSLNIRKILEDHGLDVITSEQMPRKLIEKQMKKLDHDIHFYYEREILGTIMYFLESKTVDGIIHLMIFSCGPDSIAGELASRLSKRDPTIPLLQLVFDELTGEAGLRTRIEAFADMLRRGAEKKKLLVTPEIKL